MKGVKEVAHPYVFPETAMVVLYLKYMRWARCALCGNLLHNLSKNRGKFVLEKTSLCILLSSARVSIHGGWKVKEKRKKIQQIVLTTWWCDLGHRHYTLMGLVLLSVSLVNFPYSNFIVLLRQRSMYLNSHFVKNMFTNCFKNCYGN